MTADRAVYGTPARILHWTVALIVLAIIPLGISLEHLPQGRWQDAGYDLHRSLGVLLLALMLVRIAWRLSHGAPPPPHDINALQEKAAAATHLALYVLLAVNPVVGWLATSAYGAPIIFFGMAEVPALLAKDEDMATILFGAHKLFGILTGVLVLAHIGAAMLHRFILRDSVMGRMVG
jgi:cytochrome b561